jgi:type II secretory pathway component PulC
MTRSSKFFPILFLALFYTLVQASITTSLYAQGTGPGNEPAKESKKAVSTRSRTPSDPNLKEVTRKGNVVFVSKHFSDLVKTNKAVVLSRVAVKQRVDESGKVVAYEMVQIDRKSVVEKMGFRPGDLLKSVNGVPAVDLVANQQSLEQENRFEVVVLRKGKSVKMVFEIR